MGLTKLNYNSWRHSDGWPVTLKVADAVGEVLISGPAISDAPLAFKHYIRWRFSPAERQVNSQHAPGYRSAPFRSNSRCKTLSTKAGSAVMVT